MSIEELLKKTFDEITFFETNEGYYICISKVIFRMDLNIKDLNELVFKNLSSLEIHELMENKTEFEQIGDKE